MFVGVGVCDDCVGDGELIEQSLTDKMFHTTQTNERVDELLNKEAVEHNGWLGWKPDLSFGAMHSLVFMLPNNTKVEMSVELEQSIFEAARQGGVVVDGVDLSTVHFVRCNTTQSVNDNVTQVWGDLCVIVCHEVVFVGEASGVWFVEHKHAMATNTHIAEMGAFAAANNQVWHNVSDGAAVDGNTVVDCDLVVNVTTVVEHESSSSSSSMSSLSSASITSWRSISESSSTKVSSSASWVQSSSTATTNVTIVFDDSVNIINASKESIKAIVVGLVGEDNVVDVVVEWDGAGRVVQVVVVTPGNEAAQAVVKVINDELDKEDQCTAGVLCRATEVLIEGRKEDFDGGTHLQCHIALFFLCVLQACLAPSTGQEHD